MSAFSASTVLGATQDSAILQGLLESLALNDTIDSWTTIQSMASGTFASLKSVSVTVAADEIIYFISVAAVSCGTNAEQIQFKHVINSVDQTPETPYTQRGAGNTAGDDDTIITISRVQDLTAGAKTFDLQWKRLSGAGTIYSLRGKLFALRFKRR